MEIPIEAIGGKNCKFYFCGRIRPILALIVCLGSAICGFCDESPMVSVPLGFEISGFERSRTWVSQNGVFAFGFLDGFPKGIDDDNDDDDYGFVVGIRYNLGNSQANVPVWTVGGGLRVSENSTFRLSMDGRLVLVENPIGLTVWSSNTSSIGVQRATLMNNGNFVLLDDGDKVLWESYNSPTNTLLPGQSLHFPQSLRAPSTRTISSYYSLKIRRSGELALVWENNVTYWRSHLSSSAVIKEARFSYNGVLGLFDVTDTVVWYRSSMDFEENSQVLRHLRIDSDGNLRIYSWDSVLLVWKVSWQAVENQCDVFGSCGLYSLCRYSSNGPVCDCLYEDSASSGNGSVGMDSGGANCKKMIDLGNCKMNTSMVVLKHADLYGLYPPHDVNVMLSEEACKKYCDNDTTCIAATSKNDGSGLCTIKRTSFISGRRHPSIPATSFLKVCLVPQAAFAVGVSPHGYAQKVPFPSEMFIAHGDDRSKLVGAIALIVLVTVVSVVTVEMSVLWYVYSRRKVKAMTRIPFGKDAQMNPHYSFLIRLSFGEIKELTADFSCQLGPSTFKGVLPNKVNIVVKQLNDIVASEKDFRVAASTLGGTYHRNLVPLKGFCFESEHKVLLYEYLPNGSLDKWLFSTKEEKNERNWQQRLEIAIGVARALAYLHLECQRCIAHGNLKLENVLLDEKLVPRLTDFGVRSLLQNEVASSSESLPERDIFMLGEMLLQIVMQKRDILVDDLQKLIDSAYEVQNVENSEVKEGVERVVRIALWCMQRQPFLRPSIGEVVKVLEGTLSVDRPPSIFAQMVERAQVEIEENT
ncbi:Bulb-type lectin domain [Dillenia turbinata]|uniref:Receptor-like serine/threonine-protein kinase n=1 Tax=Dillenia turbinata TaxID=194707 RepID=A0AAN8VMT6_9MAGN